MQCPSCGSRDIDFHEAGGHSACVNCGTVVEENVIVSSIEFQESGDRSSVVGQFVSATSSKPFNSAVSARGRYGNNQDSREATLANARRVIAQVASSLRLPSLYVDRAYRLYQLALQRNFIMGRRVLHVVATCLYTICRQEKSPHLLIDFSDALQINVYVLGKSFLQFSRSLNLKLPIVDPSLYIHRFAARLDLNEKLGAVITTALRIVTRLKKDWITTGRRPDGVCAVAILIACRCHGSHKTQSEISKLFRISGKTLTDRIDDFRATPSAQLTIDQFHLHDFDAEFDPPAFLKGSKKADNEKGKENDGIDPENNNKNDDDNDSDESNDEHKGAEIIEVNGVQCRKVIIRGVEVDVPLPQNKKKRKLTVNRINKSLARKVLYDDIYADIGDAATNEAAEALRKEVELVFDSGNDLGGWGTSKSHNMIMHGTSWTIDTNSTENFTAPLGDGSDIGSFSSSSASSSTSSSTFTSSSSSSSSSILARVYKDGEDYPEEEEYPEYVENSNTDKKNKNSSKIPIIAVETDPLELAAAQAEVKSVDIDGYLLDDEEQTKRAAIWEQNFRPFMDERARRKKVRDENDLMRGAGKGRKKYAKRDTPRESASQAVFDGVNTKKASKKINYDALQGAFGGDGSFKLPTQVVIDPSLNVYSSDNSRNIKPSVDGKTSASTTYPFSPFGSSSSSSSSSMRLSLQSHDKKVPLLPQVGAVSVGPNSGLGAGGTRKTFLMSESSSTSSLTSKAKTEKVAVDKKEEIPLRTGVVSTKEVLLPEDTGAMDDEDMLMYDEGDNNDDDYDDDEEY